MRHPILRAGVVVALVAFTATAHADACAGAATREPEAARALDACQATPAPTRMTEALLGAFHLPAGAVLPTAAPAVRLDAQHQPAARPHQNPAFPAAFVFQSNSALFLAVDAGVRPATRRGSAAS